jgi:hypothetical protein
VLASADLPEAQSQQVRKQIDSGSQMIAMIFKFYLQSGELDFFLRRLANLTSV